MTVKKASAPMNAFMRRRMGGGKRVEDPAELPKVKADEKVRIDFFGNEIGDADRIAGPFTELREGVTFSIDPRKL